VGAGAGAGVRGVIGEGAYGCVIDPPLKPVGGSAADWAGYVSKVFSGFSAAFIEAGENKKVDAIDPRFRWHLRSSPKLVYDTAAGEGEGYGALEDCGLFSGRLEDMALGREEVHMIQYQSGGRSLDRLPEGALREKGPAVVIPALRSLCLGVQEMAKRGYAHMDIKRGNIVFNADTNRFRFIDFGLFTRHSDMYSEMGNVIDKSYFPWPFDLKYLPTRITGGGPRALQKRREYVGAVKAILKRERSAVIGRVIAANELSANGSYTPHHRHVESQYNSDIYRGFLSRDGGDRTVFSDSFLLLLEDSQINTANLADTDEAVETDIKYIADKMMGVLYDYIDVFSLAVVFSAVYAELYGDKVDAVPPAGAPAHQLKFRDLIQDMSRPFIGDRCPSSELLLTFDSMFGGLFELGESESAAPVPAPVTADVEMDVGGGGEDSWEDSDDLWH
jgi:hypothetical protein